MTVYLKGLGSRCDQVEHDVESVTIDKDYITIDYKKPYEWGIVSGVQYYADEMVVYKVVE